MPKSVVRRLGPKITIPVNGHSEESEESEVVERKCNEKEEGCEESEESEVVEGECDDKKEGGEESEVVEGGCDDKEEEGDESGESEVVEGDCDDKKGGRCDEHVHNLPTMPEQHVFSPRRKEICFVLRDDSCVSINMLSSNFTRYLQEAFELIGVQMPADADKVGDDECFGTIVEALWYLVNEKGLLGMHKFNSDPISFSIGYD